MFLWQHENILFLATLSVIFHVVVDIIIWVLFLLVQDLHTKKSSNKKTMKLKLVFIPTFFF